MEDWKPCSCLLSCILDYMGYCPWIIQVKRGIAVENGKYLSPDIGDPRAHTLVSGSQGEGLSNKFQSDLDTLWFHDHMCGTFETGEASKDDINVETNDPKRYMFKVVKDWSPAGYCMLILASRPTQADPVVTEQIEPRLVAIDNGVTCLSSEKLLSFFAENIVNEPGKTGRAGPSQPVVYGDCIDHDNVPTFSCPCSAELDAWYKRPRHHDWPSNSLQQDVISTPANVVPVGSKDGKFDKMEWRFCFNRTELKLMHSLNITQNKVYVVLKMILKDHLKPEKKEITSYVMKNIVFWMCETNPSSSFTPNTLLSWIYVGLQTLKVHIESGNLPYYMIPARNLLHGKFLNDAMKAPLLDKLSKLLESGACFVHVCKTIQLGLELYNDGMLEDFGWKRNLVEICSYDMEFLPSNVKARLATLGLAGVTNPLKSVLLPDLKDLKEQGLTAKVIGELKMERLGWFLNPDKAEDFAKHSDLFNW